MILGPAASGRRALISILAGWGREGYDRISLLVNLLAYTVFPLIAGVAFLAARSGADVDPGAAAYYLLALGAFLLALALNFPIIAGYFSYVERSSFRTKVERTLLTGPAFRARIGADRAGRRPRLLHPRDPGSRLRGCGIFVFQYLLGAMLVSQDRADELEVRARELAGFQVAMLAALLRSLDLRDQIMARHSAAVARYSARHRRGRRALLRRAVRRAYSRTASRHRQVRPSRPNPEDERSPERRGLGMRSGAIPGEGARIVAQVEGYQGIAEIILAHHERIDGDGYPNGLSAGQIPSLPADHRVADVYDVLTAASYLPQAISSSEAIAEMRRVSGSQLDGHFVETLAELLSHGDYSYRHGEDVDFETELALDRRISEAAEMAVTPALQSSRLATNGAAPRGPSNCKSHVWRASRNAARPGPGSLNLLLIGRQPARKPIRVSLLRLRVRGKS